MIATLSGEKGYTYFRKQVLKGVARQPFDVNAAWPALQEIGKGEYNEVRRLLPQHAEQMGVPASTPLAVRRTIRATPTERLVDEAWLSSRMDLLGVSPKVFAMWIEDAVDSTTHGRLLMIVQAFERSLHDVLKQRDLRHAEEQELEGHLKAVARAGYILVDVKARNCVQSDAHGIRLVDFDPWFTIKAPELTTSCRLLAHTALLVAMTLCFQRRQILGSLLMTLAEDPCITFLDEDAAAVVDARTVWGRVEQNVSHYLRRNGCLGPEQPFWSWLATKR